MAPFCPATPHGAPSCTSPSLATAAATGTQHCFIWSFLRSNGWAAPDKVTLDKSPNCLCKDNTRSRCEVQGGRAQHCRDLLSEIPLWSGEIPPPTLALTLFWHRCQHHQGLLLWCMQRAGLTHPYLGCCILAPQIPPWLLDTKRVIFWPQSLL